MTIATTHNEKLTIQCNENTLNTTRNDNKHWKTYNGKTWTIDQQHWQHTRTQWKQAAKQS